MTNDKHHSSSTFGNFFRDKSGKIVLWQTPNAPLWMGLFFMALGWLPVSELAPISFWGSTLTFIYWAYLEITSGVNGWRRMLGLGVMIYMLIKVFTALL